MMHDFARFMAPYARRLSNMLARGVVRLADGSKKMRTLQVRLLAKEDKDEIEHFEPYGWTSEPIAGAEALAAFFDGDRTHGVVLCVADRRYRLTGLEAGEVAIFDDQGQKVHLTRDGIVISGAGLPLLITEIPTATVRATTKVRFETPLVEMTHELHVEGRIVGQGGLQISNAAGGPAATLTGDMHVTGGDVTADDISLKHHRTSGGQAGTDTIGTPVP